MGAKVQNPTFSEKHGFFARKFFNSLAFVVTPLRNSLFPQKKKTLSENRTDGLDFGCLYASQFDSKTSGLSWLSLDGANQPPLKNTEISIPNEGLPLLFPVGAR